MGGHSSGRNRLRGTSGARPLDLRVSPGEDEELLPVRGDVECLAGRGDGLLCLLIVVEVEELDPLPAAQVDQLSLVVHREAAELPRRDRQRERARFEPVEIDLDSLGGRVRLPGVIVVAARGALRRARGR